MTNLKTASTDRQKPGWWRSAVLREDAQIEHAIRNLEETGFQIVLVTDAAGKFLGTLTDGDISPEGMKFIPASQSPTGVALLAVGYEVTGSVAIYQIK
jgi:CBS-domain-containing membrane protein